jgi:glutathione synthase
MSTLVLQDMNAVYFHASNDRQFLTAALAPVLKSDVFIRRHFEMYTQLMDAGPTQTRQLQIQRSDYMLNASDERIMQVGDKGKVNRCYICVQIEVNSIAASFGALASKCARMHEHVLRRLWSQQGIDKVEINRRVRAAGVTQTNQSLDTVAEGIYEAW